MGDALLTQAPVEVALDESAEPAVRVSQSALDVTLDESVIPAALVSHAVIEVVVVTPEGEEPPPDEPPVLTGTIYSSVDLPDPSSYYLGFKDGRVLSFGTATRTLSDLTGQWSANDLSCSLADTDRSVRQVLQLAKGLRETPVIVRMISDADRRAQLTPTVVFRGALRAWKPRGDLAVDLEYTDAVGLKLARRGKDRECPTRQVTQADFPLAPSTSQAKPIPVIYGSHVLWDGACPVVYVGTVDIGGGALHTWVVAGHACKAVTGVYLDGVAVGFGANWFAPGQTGWVPTTSYWDINGRRYTVIQGTGTDADAVAAGSKTLTVNVQGIEGTGDGTGLLIEQSFLQYLHFFQQFVLRDYQNGDWPTDPILWEAGWCQINAQSFVNAQAESRRWVSGNGYIGQAYIGPDRKALRDWLADWNTSLNCRLGLNRYHQWTVCVLPGALDAGELAALPRLYDSQDVLQGSFSLEALDAEAITRATVSAYAIPKASSDYGGYEIYVDRQSEADSGAEISADLGLPFLAATPQTVGPTATYLTESAEDVAKRWIGFRSGPPLYRVTFQAGLCAYEAVDSGDLCRLTHFAGTTVSGWDGRIVWIESMALDIDQRSVTITGMDVTHCYEGARTLENIVHPEPPGPGDPPVEPPIEGEQPIAPASASGALIDATLGSAYYGTQSTTVYYKVVAVFDTGEESKPLVIGPFTTGANADNAKKRVNVTWSAYPTGTQTGRAGASVTPVAMRVYRCPDAAFLADVVQCDLTAYPVPEAPGNLNCWQKTGSGTNYDYQVSQYYYLVGEGPPCGVVTVNSGATPDVWLDWWEDPAVDALDRPGVFEQTVYGTGGGYMDAGRFGNYHDNGDDTPSGGSPWPAVTPGVDLPLTATSFYDQWPGKADEADNPWVTP